VDVNSVIQKRFKICPDDTQPSMGLRRYSRENLAELFKDLGFTKGAEIGVLNGEFSLFLFKTIPNLKLICVDTWDDYAGNKGDEIFKIAAKNLSGYNVELKRMLSVDAAKDVKDESLDFVNIDADHQFDGVMTDIIEWSKKVRPGGIIFGHDYHVKRYYGVIAAVDAYTRAHNIHTYYITRERKPSWFWVKNA